LIAVIILSVALLSLSGMQISAFYVSDKSSKLTQAMIVTQDTIELLMSLDFDSGSLSDGLHKNNELFDSPPGIKEVSWEVNGQADGTKLIKVTTKWQNRWGEKSLSLPLRRTLFQ
jgi:Tfp pilus assembly protein PilV